jgi:hypothetical protein
VLVLDVVIEEVDVFVFGNVADDFIDLENEGDAEEVFVDAIDFVGEGDAVEDLVVAELLDNVVDEDGVFD